MEIENQIIESPREIEAKEPEAPAAAAVETELEQQHVKKEVTFRQACQFMLHDMKAWAKAKIDYLKDFASAIGNMFAALGAKVGIMSSQRRAYEASMRVGRATVRNQKARARAEAAAAKADTTLIIEPVAKTEEERVRGSILEGYTPGWENRFKDSVAPPATEAEQL